MPNFTTKCDFFRFKQAFRRVLACILTANTQADNGAEDEAERAMREMSLHIITLVMNYRLHCIALNSNVP